VTELEETIDSSDEKPVIEAKILVCFLFQLQQTVFHSIKPASQSINHPSPE